MLLNALILANVSSVLVMIWNEDPNADYSRCRNKKHSRGGTKESNNQSKDQLKLLSRRKAAQPTRKNQELVDRSGNQVQGGGEPSRTREWSEQETVGSLGREKQKNELTASAVGSSL